MYDLWFAINPWLGRIGIGLLGVFVLILLVGLPSILRPVVQSYNKQIAVNRRERSAEDAVDAILRTLDETKYSVFRNVFMGYGDLDHVVIGPTGIFVIETKSNRGNIELDNGRLIVREGDATRKDYERQASGASWQLKVALSERLDTKVYVEPILAFPSASKVPAGLELRRVNEIVPVRVVHGKDLIDVIAAHRTGMSTTTIEACKKVLQDIVHERTLVDQ
ncbi:NERD domain-containing protein [bacterium]|nr:NERD domain-containing protein [bacterium]